ncbi:MAG: penicillin-insensitive murein endopeptidase, partial [Deltaproteobacteria bacterium]|nr:penicillin-insensitive murein endopeptidase [Deltaproteobacteria bacterium]
MRGRTALLLPLLLLNPPAASPGTPENFSLAGFQARARAPLVSRSVGRATQGHLESAATLPSHGPGWRLLPVVTERGTPHATDALVRLLRDAAARTARRHPGAVLEIGNASRSSGGPIVQSHSHQAGRDVDVAFLFVDELGLPVRGGRLRSCDPRGRCGGEVRLDVAATWTFVRWMLASDAPVVQWMFVSEGVKALLLAEARRRREPGWLTGRAEVVLHQPSDSKPHDDHFHVRIHCGAGDLLAGCSEYGPARSWAPELGDLVDRTARDLARRAARGTKKERREALAGLTRLQGAKVPEELLTPLLPGAEPEAAVRLGALLAATGSRTAVAAVAAAAVEARQGSTALALLQAVADRRDEAVLDACRTLLGRKETGPRT